MVDAFTRCEDLSTFVTGARAGSPFLYDIRKWGDIYGATLAPALARYLNRTDVKAALHVTGHAWKNGDGTSAPNPVVNAIRTHLMDSSTRELGAVLAHGVPVVVYDGVLDASSCNHLSVYDAVLMIEDWPGKEAFHTAPREVWHGPQSPYGYWQAGGGLHFAWVANCGHLVPYDQPAVALELLSRTLALGASRRPVAGASVAPEEEEE